MITEIILDLNGLNSEEEFHERVVKSFGFPYYYGRNEDAFWDCITEIFDETKVIVAGLSSLNGNIRQLVSSYVKLLEDYEIERSGRFHVVIQ